MPSYSPAFTSAPSADSFSFATSAIIATDLSSLIAADTRSSSALICNCCEFSSNSLACENAVSDSNASLADCFSNADACSSYSSASMVSSAAFANSSSASVYNSIDSDCNSRPSSESIADLVCSSIDDSSSAVASSVISVDFVASSAICVRCCVVLVWVYRALPPRRYTPSGLLKEVEVKEK